MERKKILNIPLAIMVFLLVVAYFLEVNYFEYWLETTFLTLIGTFTLYSMRYLAKSNKTRKDSLKLAVVFVWTLFHMAMYLRVKYIDVLLIVLFIAGFGWLIREFIDLANKKNYRINVPMFLGLLLMGLEVVIRISWWPYASITHITGLLLISIGFLVEYSRYREQVEA